MIDNSVEIINQILPVRSLIAKDLDFSKFYRSWIVKSGLGSLKRERVV